jgi:hypothetical protein
VDASKLRLKVVLEVTEAHAERLRRFAAGQEEAR